MRGPYFLEGNDSEPLYFKPSRKESKLELKKVHYTNSHFDVSWNCRDYSAEQSVITTALPCRKLEERTMAQCNKTDCITSTNLGHFLLALISILRAFSHIYAITFLPLISMKTLDFDPSNRDLTIDQKIFHAHEVTRIRCQKTN